MLDARSETADRTESRFVVIGEGHDLGGDDRVGLEIVRKLRRRAIPGCTFVEMPESPFDLLDSLHGEPVVIIIDAVTSGAVPGTIHIVPFESDVVRGRHEEEVSTHGFRVLEIVKLASALGHRLHRIVVIGIEIGTETEGTTLSTPVAEAATYIEERFGEIRDAIAQNPRLESHALPRRGSG